MITIMSVEKCRVLNIFNILVIFLNAQKKISKDMPNFDNDCLSVFEFCEAFLI